MIILEIIFGLKPELANEGGIDDSGAFDRDMIGTSVGKSDPRPMSFKKWKMFFDN